MRLILASNSPRRAELLKQLAGDFEIIPSTISEANIKAVEKDPLKLVERLSEAKAEDVFNKEQGEEGDLLVIGADTIVYIDGEILGKPRTEERAYNMLSKLQGRENEVYTGLGVMARIAGNIIREVYSDKSTVKIKPMSNENILEYIATKEPLDKAGGYAIQGIGAKYIENVEGNFNTVVGMDTDKVKEILAKYFSEK